MHGKNTEEIYEAGFFFLILPVMSVRLIPICTLDYFGTKEYLFK
jgi:hypothetical protein